MLNIIFKFIKMQMLAPTPTKQQLGGYRKKKQNVSPNKIVNTELKQR